MLLLLNIGWGKFPKRLKISETLLSSWDMRLSRLPRLLWTPWRATVVGVSCWPLTLKYPISLDKIDLGRSPFPWTGVGGCKKPFWFLGLLWVTWHDNVGVVGVTHDWFCNCSCFSLSRSRMRDLNLCYIVLFNLDKPHR